MTLRTGYLLVFLIIQPSAFSSFKVLIGLESEVIATVWTQSLPGEIDIKHSGSSHLDLEFNGSESAGKGSSLFSLANMDEEELAQELDRTYNLAMGTTSSSIGRRSSATPSLAAGNLGEDSRWGRRQSDVTLTTEKSFTTENSLGQDRLRSTEAL